MTTEWLIKFISNTNLKWQTKVLDPCIYGFQIQPGTRWLDGMKNVEISEMETLKKLV